MLVRGLPGHRHSLAPGLLQRPFVSLEAQRGLAGMLCGADLPLQLIAFVDRLLWLQPNVDAFANLRGYIEEAFAKPINVCLSDVANAFLLAEADEVADGHLPVALGLNDRKSTRL